MNTAGIILLIIFIAVCVFELISLVMSILKRKKLQNKDKKIEVNNVKQEDSQESVPQESSTEKS